jgi:hypothetical protein
MKMAAAFLRSAVHLIVEDSFAISIFFVVVVATVLAFGLGVATGDRWQYSYTRPGDGSR